MKKSTKVLARKVGKNQKVTASEWLRWYEHHLLFWLWCTRKFKRCEPEEADVVLFTREDLWKALRQSPDGLTKNERRKLRELDNLLKANADLMAKALPELPQIRRRLKPPRSHWWWFLDKLAKRQNKTKRNETLNAQLSTLNDKTG